jgi:hypothetical protein
VLLANGDGTFHSLIRLNLPTGGNDPGGVAAADLNGDGLVDLVAANIFFNSGDAPSTVSVLLNNSSGAVAAATTTTLATSAPTAVFGQTVVLTANVNSKVGVHSGTVSFLDGTTVLDTAPVDASGQAALRVALGAGGHALTASFVGTGGFADSTSAAVTETINRAATTVGLTSSVNPAVTGQTVTFTATLAAVAPAGTPTGTVTFQDDTVVLGTVAVGAGGTATFTTSFAPAGGRAITAAYNGDSNFAPSAQTLTEQVNVATTRNATTTILLASANPVGVGQAVTFTATVRDSTGTGTPTGTVTSFVGSTAVARVTLDGSGRARIRLSFLRTGRFTVRAVYSGDARFDTSSQSLTEQVS